MLTCIVCSKQLGNAGSLSEQPDDDVNVSTPSTRQAIKALTAQIKCMAVKASGAYKHCKPCAGSLRNKRSRAYMDSDADSVSERFYCSYRRNGSSNSTPRLWGREAEATLDALLSGTSTPISISSRTESVVFVEEDEPKEWVAQVEPGVLITFVSLPQAGNHLKRIRFSREIFNKWQAQRWWEQNHDNVMELYNVQRFNPHTVPLPAPPRSEDEENSKLDSAEGSPAITPLTKERATRHFHRQKRVGNSLSESSTHQQSQSWNPCNLGAIHSTSALSNIDAGNAETPSIDASARSSYSREVEHSGNLSVSDASELETEWVEQDVPGVFITIRTLTGGTRELKRVRFSRERFEEGEARVWWEENRVRIQKQYL